MSDSHNVIIFGAGASFDAGIPLLGTFVEQMWDYLMRKRAGDQLISPEKLKILEEANNIRLELEAYQSRAFFDARNLEDILSMLIFEKMGGRATPAEKYNKLVQAISVTFELATRFPYCEDAQAPYLRNDRATNPYYAFWQAILCEKMRNNAPTLITFNYDLVFERSLWQYLHRLDPNPSLVAPKCIQMLYHLVGDPEIFYQVKPHKYDLRDPNPTIKAYPGIKCEVMREGLFSPDLVINFLKLHGSLNWGQDYPGVNPDLPTKVVSQPLILPPVFNKMNSSRIESVWAKALEVLRQAKNIIIVGYSLPRTDIYMQYFLKSAVGPNVNLNRLTVFDPVLFKEGNASADMRKRYSDCFSAHLQDRIVFQPAGKGSLGKLSGTFQHFVAMLNQSPEDILFLP